jgi:flagellum-specific peptidoglycan hydrolase FlgJ
MIHHISRASLLMLLCLVLSVDTCYAQKKNQALIDSIACYICASDIAHKEIVMHQAILETGWFRAEFLMSRNNLFGFRSKNYLRFNNWKESVDYYQQWQKKRYTDPKEDYYKFLERIKYGSRGYSNGLRKIKYTLKCPCTE